MKNSQYFVLTLIMILALNVNAQTPNSRITLNAPTDLVATVVSDDVNLTWTEPVAPPPSGFLRYDNDMNAGSKSVGNLTVAVRWDAGDLEAYNEYNFTKVKFYVGEIASAVIILKVWEGAAANNVLVSQQLADVTDGWNEFDLETPIAIDGSKEYWVGYSVVNGAGANIPGYDAGPVVNGYGNMVFFNNTWQNVAYGNWNIAIYADDGMSSGAYVGDELLSYNVYRDTELIAQDITEANYADENLFGGTYTYSVSAVYTQGESEKSNSVEAIVADPELLPPTNLTTEVSSDAVTLAWSEPNPGSEDLLSYNIYRDNVLISQSITETNFVNEAVSTGTHFYAVSAVYNQGESVFSNVALAVVEGITGKVQGFIRDASTNLSIEGATLTAEGIDNGTITSVTPFGSHYSMLLAPGTYDLSCNIDGYQEAIASNLVITENMNTSYTFYLDAVTETLTGINEITANEVNIFPNPAKENVNIHSGEIIQNLKVINLSGQIVMEAQPAGKEFTYNTNQLMNGVYYVQIKTQKGTSIQKLIVE